MVLTKDSSAFLNKNITLCEQFVNGLRDPFLGKEAKRLLWSNPTEFLAKKRKLQTKDQLTPSRNNPNTISDQPSARLQTLPQQNSY